MAIGQRLRKHEPRSLRSHTCTQSRGGCASDDGLEEDDLDGFGMEMSREEKIAARRPWRNSLIIKLVGNHTVSNTYGNTSKRCRERSLSRC